MAASTTFGRTTRFWLGVAVKLTLLGAFLLAASHAGSWLTDYVQAELTPEAETEVFRVVVVCLLLYVVLMTLPFVPGIEIGLGLIMMFGRDVVPVVYASTVLALCLAFLVGRLVPERLIVRGLDGLLLRRASALLHEVAGLDTPARLEFLLRNVPSGWAPVLLRYRFLALLVLFNLPGNAILGGGGGIGLVAGSSRLFSFRRYAVAVALAVAPIPILVMLFGA